MASTQEPNPVMCYLRFLPSSGIAMNHFRPTSCRGSVALSILIGIVSGVAGNPMEGRAVSTQAVDRTVTASG